MNFKYIFIINKFKSLTQEPISKYTAITTTNGYNNDINKARRLDPWVRVLAYA